jgi:uncharacterized membrane protein YeaQ/YmgE (transglycosylase-associated protein family)
MNATIINLIIQLLSGAAGGNIIGNILKQYNLGPIGNSIAGIVGGGLGGQLLNMVLGSGAAAVQLRPRAASTLVRSSNRSPAEASAVECSC